MKKNLLFRLPIFFVFFALFWMGCGPNDVDTSLDDTPFAPAKFGKNFRFYTNSHMFQKELAQNTSLSKKDLSVKGIKREKESLKIIVNYSGGCKNQTFDVIWDGVVHFSENGKGKVSLIVNKVGKDECEAIVTDTILINPKIYFNNLVDISNTDITILNSQN